MRAAFIASLFAATALASPAASNCKVDSTYEIDNLTTRKYDGKTINTLFFDVKATNGGTLDFECSPHDEVTGKNLQGFESGRSYSCGKNSFFYFRYKVGGDDEKDQLMLWQDVTDTKTIAGTIVAPQPTVCHAGGSTVNDLVCSWPSGEEKKIAMKKL